MSLTNHLAAVPTAWSKLVSMLLLSSALSACAVPGREQIPVAGAPSYPSPAVTKLNATLPLKSASLDPSKVAFSKHTGNTPFGNYLAVAINFEPIAQLRQQLEQAIGQPLNHRGEAHITVITPPEYNVLADYVSIDLLNQRYGDFIQHTNFTPICVGRAVLRERGELLETWYLAIESEDLHALRTEVEHLYYERGGPRPAFANPYHPHITIGFSKRDLYAQDGAVKNDSSCVYAIELD